MSSKADARKFQIFCNHLREAITDEKKAVPDYKILIKQAKQLNLPYDMKNAWEPQILYEINEIIKDEQRHKKTIEVFFNKFCRIRRYGNVS